MRNTKVIVGGMTDDAVGSVARRLVVSPKALRPNTEGFRYLQAPCQLREMSFLATMEYCL